MEIRRIETAEYARELPETGVEPFHDPAALSAVADHAEGELRIFGGYKGERAVALLPTFVRERAVGRVVTSPPPGMGIPRLGPVVFPASPKRRKRERVNGRFVEGVLEQLQGPDAVLRLITGTAYGDPRPYDWAEMDVQPAFTYRVDATDPETTMSGFSKSLRRSVRDARELPVTVEREGVTGAHLIYRDTAQRYAQQDEPFRLEWPYVRNLFERLGERARAYVLRDDRGEFLGGITVLYSPEAAYFWQGGGKTTYEGVDVNALLHWRVLEDVAEDPPVESVEAYDLMGANTERLCQYKAKFGPELAPYYVVESSGPAATLAKRAYRTIK